MTYELRDHTADIAVEATGATLSATFGAVADGLTAASCESLPATDGDRFGLTVTAESREALLFDYLDRLIYERDVRSILPADHDCRVSSPDDTGTTDEANDATDPEWTVEATARGVPFAGIAAREIKAVTYSEMTLERRDGGWYAYVVFDV